MEDTTMKTITTHIPAHSVKEAWEIVNKYFPSDYEKDEKCSEKAGYPVYRSTSESLPNAYYNYICDLGNCIEINLCDEDWQGSTIRVEIREPEQEEVKLEEAVPAEMHEYTLTIGLFDKDTEKQEISTEAARRIISDVLINSYDIFAYTMLDAAGVYKMQSTGAIVREPSIRLEIVTEEAIDDKIRAIVNTLKDAAHLNQESIMVKHTTAPITFM
jgi:hypothetical protein